MLLEYKYKKYKQKYLKNKLLVGGMETSTNMFDTIEPDTIRIISDFSAILNNLPDESLEQIIQKIMNVPNIKSFITTIQNKKNIDYYYNKLSPKIKLNSMQYLQDMVQKCVGFKDCKKNVKLIETTIEYNQDNDQIINAFLIIILNIIVKRLKNCFFSIKAEIEKFINNLQSNFEATKEQYIRINLISPKSIDEDVLYEFNELNNLENYLYNLFYSCFNNTRQPPLSRSRPKDKADGIYSSPTLFITYINNIVDNLVKYLLASYTNENIHESYETCQQKDRPLRTDKEIGSKPGAFYNEVIDLKNIRDKVTDLFYRKNVTLELILLNICNQTVHPLLKLLKHIFTTEENIKSIFDTIYDEDDISIKTQLIELLNTKKSIIIETFKNFQDVENHKMYNCLV